MILLMLLVIAAGLLLSYAHWIEPSLLLTREVEFSVPQNQQDTIESGTKELQVVWFSDTHFGEYYDEKNMGRIAEQINKLHPDLVLFGGDLMDSYYRSPPDLSVLKQGLSSIQAGYGKFAVFGNHDYGGGAVNVYKNLMTESGFRVLKNETIELEETDISLTGLDDYLLGHPDVTLTEQLSTRGCNLLLSHAPDLTDRMNLDQVHVMLSGHTHGGQVYIPFLMRWILPPGGRKYRKGQFSLPTKSETQLYVSSGIGMTQVPFRMGNPPEILSVTIRY